MELSGAMGAQKPQKDALFTNPRIAKGNFPIHTIRSTRSLQKEGLVKRTKRGKVPPYTVEYSITKSGIDLIVASSALVKWAMKNKR